jgi:hypothetical protein
LLVFRESRVQSDTPPLTKLFTVLSISGWFVVFPANHSLTRRYAVPELSQVEKDEQITYLTGRFDMCKLLATSPRFNKPQLEIIKEQAYQEQERLEDLGVEFTEPVPR